MKREEKVKERREKIHINVDSSQPCTINAGLYIREDQIILKNKEEIKENNIITLLSPLFPQLSSPPSTLLLLYILFFPIYISPGSTS